ncbi:non-receptor serine/threonine protein kinase [Lithospermum erythrorhizon]|uniref:Non-receptor serine/threonine protein kinase n=1 Tax=Lithospermum erythrorhizon TaxID=34254 RepID=A0AAV3NYG4_LITER
MSNLTCASGEASGSSGNRPNDVVNGDLYSPTQSQPPLKRKRNLPGNPDPEAEVIALSPKTLMARNRFVCEICNKGFQRDQNLQLHRRGHNLPWKLKQRNKEEVIRKKVYVCPETSCVHHDPSRALGDLTGIKKHFSRKHGEKNWKCEKCSKLYAVQADWKAHSKTCGTKEYRCDCGTIFSRRDSFITHRAFCDALAEESARAIIENPNPIIYSTHPQQPCASSTTLSSPINDLQVQPSVFSNHDNNNIIQPFLLKKEPHSFGLIRPQFPQWLANCPPPPPNGSNNLNSLSIFSTRNPNPNIGTALAGFHNVPTTSTPATSATALLQKAAQMGATMSDTENNVSDFALNVTPAHMQIQDRISNSGFVNNFTLYDNNKALENDNDGATIHGGSSAPPPPPYASLLQDMMMGSFTSASGFESSTFEDAFRGFLEHNKKDNNQESHLLHGAMSRSSGDGDGDGMTRDFLGLGPFSHSDIFNIPGFETSINTSSNSNEQQTQAQKPFRG